LKRLLVRRPVGVKVAVYGDYSPAINGGASTGIT